MSHTYQTPHEDLDSEELLYIYSSPGTLSVEWHAPDCDESISTALTPLDFSWVRIFLGNCRACSLKSDVTPEDTFLVSEASPMHAAQYCCDLFHGVFGVPCTPRRGKTKEQNRLKGVKSQQKAELWELKK